MNALLPNTYSFCHGYCTALPRFSFRVEDFIPEMLKDLGLIALSSQGVANVGESSLGHTSPKGSLNIKVYSSHF